MGRILEKKLAEAGYRLLGTTENKEELILDLLKTKDARYLKAIPFLIYQYNPDLDEIYRKTAHKELFGQIIEFTKKIFADNNINRQLPNIIGKSDLNYEEFKQGFDLQRYNAEKPQLMIEKQKAYAERDLQMWLAQLFTKKERQIMRRILTEKPVSKTDYEYYSRKTKKKLNGIVNLQDFARTLYTKSPIYDEELFKLKRLLEELLEKKENRKKITIQRFFISNDTISIFFEETDSKYPQKSTQLDFKKIDEKIKRLLKKYTEQDFN